MRPSLPSALLVALALPALAADSISEGSPLPPVDVSEALVRLDDAKTLGQPLTEPLGDLGVILAAQPGDVALRSRLMAHVEDLVERARGSFVSEVELAALRREFVAARLERALDALGDRALAGRWTREQYGDVAAAMIQRAEVFVDAPDPSGYRARVMAALERSMMRAVDARHAIETLRLELIGDRLQLLSEALDREVAEGRLGKDEAARIIDRQVLRAWTYYQSLGRA